jgi:hypothetical protein
MNITDSEASYDLVAKTCACKEKQRKVTYSFVDTYHSLSKDKKDIMMSEIQACERLRNYTRDGTDMKAIEAEIAELTMTLDLLP